MVSISGTVGPGQTNARADVAIVQAALNFVNAANGAPFLRGGIDGRHGPGTQAAINAFQAAHGADAAPTPAGAMRPGGATIAALNTALPANRRDLRALPGQAVVYLGRPLADATASQRAIQGNLGLRPVFRNRLAALVGLIHTAHGLVTSLTPTGGRRTFAEQALIRPPASYAGPGESNHNYGNAADLGFNGTTWLTVNGGLVPDNHWLAQLERANAAAAGAFWDARDAFALAAPTNFFRLGFERIHLQDFDPNTTSSGRSLAAHLTLSGAWRWQTAHYDRPNRDWHYACDLGGVNGTFVTVGTAEQIFAGNATVTATEIVNAGWVRPGAANNPLAPGGAAPGGAAGAAGATGPQPATQPITPADIAAVRQALQADFQAADRNWANWTPVP